MIYFNSFDLFIAFGCLSFMNLKLSVYKKVVIFNMHLNCYLNPFDQFMLYNNTYIY